MGNNCCSYEGEERYEKQNMNMRNRRKNQYLNQQHDLFQRTIEDCQDEIYTDHEFPAIMESILGTSKDSSKMEDINRFCDGWTRASDFPTADNYVPEIFRDGIHPNDIKQGMLGDCYFVAALASLAEWPNRVEKIFASTVSNEKQVFGINLYKDGIFQTIIVDNYFPTFNRNVNRVRKANGEELGKEGEPIFAAAYGNELWVALAEKAYAKAHHGYVIIAGGSCGPTMRDLCGAPAYTYIFEEGNYPENLWENIIEGEKKNYAMSAGTPGVDEGEYDDKGIVPGHAYSLLAARSVYDKYGDQVNLV